MNATIRILVVTAIALVPAALFAKNDGIARVHGKIPNRYIVVLNEARLSRSQVPQIAADLAKVNGGKLRLVMNNAALMFSVEMTEPQAQALSMHPLVLQVEEVGAVYLSEIQTLPPPSPLNWMDLWNLDRIDQWGTPNSNAYQFCERTLNVIAYMPDTGVMGDHQEFRRNDGTSRVKRGVCFAEDCTENRGDVICPDLGGRTNHATYSHGTAVASILGGRTVGVAKNITIVPLRFFTCASDQGLTSDTERLNWALDWIRSSSNPDRNVRPALVSMSTYVRMDDTRLSSFEHVINGLVLDDPANNWKGIPVIVSANNQGNSTCITSPARMAYRNASNVATPGFASTGRVISVGGSGRQTVNGVLRDVRWQCRMFTNEPCLAESCTAADGTLTIIARYGSNHGNTVDIYAPAHHVEAAHTTAVDAYRRDTAPPPPLDITYTNNQYYALKSGTSFAAPLVAGIAARILQIEPNLTPTQVWDRIRNSAQIVATPFDSSGVDQNGNPTSNSRLALRRYTSSVCSVEYP